MAAIVGAGTFLAQPLRLDSRGMFREGRTHMLLARDVAVCGLTGEVGSRWDITASRLERWSERPGVYDVCRRCAARVRREPELRAGHITPPDHFTADLANLSEALAPFVLVLSDGTEVINPSAPIELRSAYHALVQYGYANGWLS